MNKSKKKPLSQRVCENLDVPMGTFGRTSFIEAVGNRQVTVSGCEGLHTYTENKIVLELCDGPIILSGQSLELKSFSGGDVAVTGIITDIHYGEEIEDGNDS